jgi:hypothetical protein
MRSGNLICDLAPYIAAAAAIAFLLVFCSDPFTTGSNASGRIGFQNEPAQLVNIVDRSHKGDRFSGGQQTYGQAASGNTAIGDILARPDQTVPRNVPRSSHLQPKLPDGCEAAFGPLAPEDRKNIADRCVT